ncbi:1-phosphofructokinase family hexose kinase [Propionispira raffinosivorans]|uniref:1-phosphofructokinase family hexose kinase n=1 Tax=Propionispira raffinosivorans TaxID=86959 RepID=UPI00036160C6|nr:1-phosphofructokinase family hexose kinase [Propionispira raffinosivorans]
MILAVNLNASVDKRYELDEIKTGCVMRARSVENTAGGKGIHVANVATILGDECLVTGFLGGKSGEFIEAKLQERGIKQDFVKIQGHTRECLAFITADKVQTEILEPGPEVTRKEQEIFLDQYKDLLEGADLVAASGSLPRNTVPDFYRKLIDLSHQAGKRFLLDASGKFLQEGIKSVPFFIKPNQTEVEALTGRAIKTPTDAVREIKLFQKAGITFVVISFGSQGSVAGYENHFYHVTFPSVNAVNPVGSGDAYVAGVAVGLARNYEIKELLKFASACGTANAMEKESGFVNLSTVNTLKQLVQVQELS